MLLHHSLNFEWSIQYTWFRVISNDRDYNHRSICPPIFLLVCARSAVNLYLPMYIYTVWHKRIIQIYTFSQTSRKNRKWLHFHSYCSIALIVGLNFNFYYLHSARHKLSAVHISYNCTLPGRTGNNYVVVQMLLKLTSNRMWKYL
jgi:hypothetical protein